MPVEQQPEDVLTKGIQKADLRQQVVEFDDAMEQTDDPGILMQGLEFFIDNITKPGDWYRAYMAEKFELDVDADELRDGRLEPDKLLKSLLPPELAKEVDLVQISEADLQRMKENLTWSERALTIGHNITSNTMRLGAQIATDVATDPLSFMAGAAAFLKNTFRGVKKVTQEAGIAARARKGSTPKPVVPKAEVQVVSAKEISNQLKTVGTKRIKGEELTTEELKTVAEFPQTKPSPPPTASPITPRQIKATASPKDIANKVLDKAQKMVKKPTPTVAKREARTIEQIQVAGEEALIKDGLGHTLETLRTIPINTPVGASSIAQWSQAQKALIQNLLNTTKARRTAEQAGDVEKVKQLTDESANLNQAILDIEQSVKTTSGAAGEVLRFLQEVDVSTSPFRKALEESGGRFDVYLDGLAQIDDPVAFLQTMQRANVTNPKARAQFYEAFRHFLLANYMSNPATHALNIQTSAFVLAKGGLDRTVAPLVAKLTRQPPAIELADAGMYWLGAMRGLTNASIAAAKAPFDKRQAMDKLLTSRNNPRTKLSQEFSDVHEKPRLQHHDTDSASIKGLKMATNGVLSVYDVGLSALGATDHFFREVLAQAELGFQVSSEARRIVNTLEQFNLQKGLEAYTPLERTKLERQHRTAMIKDPDSYVDLSKNALDFADEGVFTQRLEGFQKRFQDIRDAPGFGGKIAKILIPFFKGIANLGNYEARNIPAIQLFSKKFRAQLESTDPIQKQLAFANMAVGYTTVGVGLELALNGNCHGAYPKNPKQRKLMQETGVPEYSCGFDTDNDGKQDKWIAYNNFGVFGTMLGTVSNLVQSADYIAQEEFTDAVSVTAAGVAELMLDKTIAQSVHDTIDQLFKIVDDPTTFSKQVQNQLIGYSLLNPGLARFTKKVQDPVLRDEVGFLERIFSKTPFISDTIPSERDILGDDIITLDVDPNEDSVVYQSLIAFTGTAARTGSLNEKQKKAREVLQPLLDHGIDISRPTREFGDVVLNKEQTESYYDVFYKGGVPGLDTSLILDLANAQRDWKLVTANMDQERIRENLLTGGMTHDQVADLTPTKILQTLVNSQVRKRKDAALSHILDTFEGLAEKLSAQKILQSIVTGDTVNRLAVDTEGRTVDSIMQQREEERAPAQSVIERVKESTDRVIDDVQLTLGGV